MPAPLAISRQRVPALDGLRGLAILLVVVFHFVSQEGVQPPGSITDRLQRLVIMGWSGVDLFFVLSGFLIGGILMEVRRSPSYFKTFYARRFFRIVPIYYLWILLYAALIAVAGRFITQLSNSGIPPPLDLGTFSYFLFLQNVVPVTLFGLAGAWFGHLWSLAVEEQFYLVAPMAVRLMPTRGLKWILLAVILGLPLLRVFLLRVANVAPSSVGSMVVTRGDSLAMGFLAAALTHGDSPVFSVMPHVAKLRAALVALAVGVAALWFYSPQALTFGMQSLGYTWMALFYATILLLGIGQSEGWIARALRVAWLRELGIVSYCVYIIHIVVNVALHALLLHRSPRISTAKGASVTVLAAFITYGLAKLSWLLFEAPLQRRGHTFKY
jgi:peptidoglycan/LPS O-acetylase OafA/YrhL